MLAEDNTENMEWMSEEERRVIMHGSAEAICNLGQKYRLAGGVQQDYSRAVQAPFTARTVRYCTFATPRHQGPPHPPKFQKSRPSYQDGPSPEKLAGPELKAMLAEDNTENMGWMSEEEWRVTMHGSADAIFNLGYKYQLGDGVRQDYVRAAEFYHEAARQGNARAQCNLGYMTGCGKGVAKDLSRAAEWYAQSANQGHAIAQYSLANMYSDGRGVSQDAKKAVELYQLAVAQGDPTAQLNLGVMYEDGVDVPKDVHKARELFENAAAQGNGSAQTNLGRMHYSGNGIPQNFTKAAAWFQRAFDTGDPGAMYNLGLMHYAGEGIAMDRPKGIQLITQAAANGAKKAQGFLADLEADVASAEAMAQQLMQEEEATATKKTTAKQTPGKKKKKDKQTQVNNTLNQVTPETSPPEGDTSKQ